MTSRSDLGVNDVGTQLFGPERLADLDLSVHTIEVALRKADAATNAGSDLDPPIMEGLNRWGLTTRYLREALVAAKWSFDNPRNLARTIHPSGDFAVVVTTGDESTGLPHRTPGPKHPKGFATELAVLGNNQLALDLGPLLPTVRQGRAMHASPPRTWFLLFHADVDSFRAEVSLPECFADGWITKWAERILLPPIRRAPHAAVADVVRVEWTTVVGTDSVTELAGRSASSP
jgi:hypothetical protein